MTAAIAMARERRRGTPRRTEDLPAELLIDLAVMWDRGEKITRIRERIWGTWRIDLTDSRISYICVHQLGLTPRYVTIHSAPRIPLGPHARGQLRLERRAGSDRRHSKPVLVACEQCRGRFEVVDLDLRTACPRCGHERLPPGCWRMIS